MITLPLKDFKEAIDKVFTSKGLSFGNVSIKLPQPLSMIFGTDGKNVSLSFTKDLPKISWKKFITLSTWIREIVLSEKGGTIRLRYFPDLNFSYHSGDESFGYNLVLDDEDMQQEIKAQYPDVERQKIAKLCLQYVSEWVTICYSSGVDREQFKNQKLKKDCYNFVRESIKKDEKYGSIIGIILIFVVLPVILRWVIDRVFARVVG
jgi:hypothetical protein